jgi:hypothetical protein
MYQAAAAAAAACGAAVVQQLAGMDDSKAFWCCAHEQAGTPLLWLRASAASYCMNLKLPASAHVTGGPKKGKRGCAAVGDGGAE